MKVTCAERMQSVPFEELRPGNLAVQGDELFLVVQNGLEGVKLISFGSLGEPDGEGASNSGGWLIEEIMPWEEFIVLGQLVEMIYA